MALAEEHGTPLVVYDEGALRALARAYRDAFAALQPDAEVIYASKAYFGLAMLRLAREEGLSVDVASGGELFAALRAGFPPERIHMHGNNKDAREIGEALDAGVGTIIVDNLDEIALLDREAAARGRAPARADPGDARREAVQPTPTSRPASSTRSSASRSRAAPPPGGGRRRARPRSLELAGLHCHIGSQLFDLAGYGAAARRSWPTSPPR